MKRTLVIGASENTERYSNRAMRQLKAHGHEVLALGLKKGMVEEIAIDTGRPDYKDLNTVTIYIGPAHQPEYYTYILALKPRRIIFNPGTENRVFMQQAESAGIECIEACTLVMLSVGNY